MTGLAFDIRAPKLSDMEDLISIYQQASPDTPQMETIKKTIKQNIENINSTTPFFFNVACHNHQILAYSIARCRAQENLYEVECACLYEFRNHGIGYALVSRLLDDCYTQGISLFIANIRSDNLASHNLFKKLGFKPTLLDSPSREHHRRVTLNLRHQLLL